MNNLDLHIEVSIDGTAWDAMDSTAQGDYIKSILDSVKANPHVTDVTDSLYDERD